MAEIIDINTLFGPSPAAASDLSVDDLTALMDRHSIRQSCTLSTVGALLDHNAGNSATKAACSENSRLVPAATVNPMAFFGDDGPHARFKSDGFKIVRFFPGLQGWSPAAESFGAVVRALADQSLPLMVDVCGSGSASDVARTTGSYAGTIVLAGVDQETAAEAVALMRVHKNICVETSSLLATGAVRLIVDRVGPDRVLFGSGSPSRPTASGLAMLKRSALSDEHLQQLLGGNAKRLLGL